jgi:hypothetical protein
MTPPLAPGTKPNKSATKREEIKNLVLILFTSCSRGEIASTVLSNFSFTLYQKIDLLSRVFSRSNISASRGKSPTQSMSLLTIKKTSKIHARGRRKWLFSVEGRCILERE